MRPGFPSNGGARARQERRRTGPNTIACATSSGSPTRLRGTHEIRPAFPSSLPVKRSNIPVWIGPGAMLLTRTPNPAASDAAGFVGTSTACLLAT